MKDQFAHKGDILISLFGLSIAFSLWAMLWASLSNYSNINNEVQLNNMITYTAIVHLLLLMQINNMKIRWEFTERVKSGEIIMEFLHPINLGMRFMCERMGYILPIFVIIFLPVSIFLIYYNTLKISLFSFFIFIIGVLISFIIGFLINFLFCLLMLKFVEAGGAWSILDSIIFLFGGLMVPVWIYPDSLQQIVYILPFQYIYYVPVNLLINYNTMSIEKTLLIGSIWIIILTFLIHILWSNLRKNMVIQGG